MRRILVLGLLLAAGPAYAQTGTLGGSGGGSSTARRIATGLGAPAADQCAVLVDVGKVYIRRDAQAPYSSYYVCAQTGAGTYAWELGGGGGSGTGGGEWVALDYSQDPTPDFDASSGKDYSWTITLTGDVASSTLTAPSSGTGQTYTFRICQDGTGGRTFVWPASVSEAATVNATASACTNQAFRWNGSAAVAVAPAYVTNVTGGALELPGSTSGVLTIQPPAIVNTWSLTYPDNDGDAGQALITDGSGNTSWGTVASSGSKTLVQFLHCAGPCEVNETTNWKVTIPCAVAAADGTCTTPMNVEFNACTIDATTYPTGAPVTVQILKNPTVGGVPGNYTISGGTSIFGVNPILTLPDGGTVPKHAAPEGTGKSGTTGDFFMATATGIGSSEPGQNVNVICPMSQL